MDQEQSILHIHLGQSFNSFEDVTQAVRRFECQHAVRLAPKYFRRIAANPKPSNVEDYQLTKEERNRFLYRWVDFCCTHFEAGMLPLPEDDSGNVTVERAGFTLKECPMRIRLQLRFQEKDLIVTSFCETHDHDSDHNQQPQSRSHFPQSSSVMNPQFHTCHAKLVDDSTCSARQRIVSSAPARLLTTRPPPSLAPLPLRGTRHQSTSNSIRLVTHSSSLMKPPLPKPPPLKKGGTSHTLPPVRERGGTIVSNFTRKGDEPRSSLSLHPSAELIIWNVYSYLLRNHRNQSSFMRNGITFTWQNPNFIKLTSELSGINEQTVQDIILRKSPKIVESTGGQDRGNCDESSYTPSVIIRKRKNIDAVLPGRFTKQNSSLSEAALKIRKRFNSRGKASNNYKVAPNRQNITILPPNVLITKSEPKSEIEDSDSNEDEFILIKS